ncbi:MAG: hypothetical protein P1U68_06480 [Verrucomicrobiales bacterium]|nr:hypothetical protein [Verrucomicrobiales bacterium]
MFPFAIAASLGFSGCETTGNSDGEVISPSGASQSGPINAIGFLKTDYEPLNKWLDESFAVDYKHMTPTLIFDQVPLNDIFYETSNLPTSAPAFNFSSPQVTRRELLKKIANHWRLKMSFVTDAGGTPTAVKVEG